VLSVGLLQGCATDESVTLARAELRNSGTPFGRNAFIQAVNDGDSKKVALFIEADIPKDGWRGANPLGVAVFQERNGIVDQLLDAGFDPDMVGYGGTPLCVAASKGNIEAAQSLIAKGADVDFLEDGLNPLILAATAGHADIVQLLLEKGADPDIQSDTTETTPLMAAAANGNAKAAAALIDGGADTSLEDANGNTALYWAVRRNEHAIAVAIVESADFEPGDDAAVVAALAMTRHYNNVLKTLLDKGFDPNSNYGSIPIISWAASQGYDDGVRILLNAGADAEIADDDGSTPLDYALKSGEENVVSILKNAAATKKTASDKTEQLVEE